MEKTEKSVKKEQPKLTARVPVKCPLTEINKFLMCELCSGYLVDATAIIECQHTFCKSCILHYLDSNSYCPICDVQLNKAKPHLSLRADTILQKMVYKMVPGLFVTEVRRRREFAKKKSDGSKKKDNNNEKSGECEGVNAILEDTEDLCVLSLDDSVSLSLEYLKSTNKEEEGKDGKPGSPKKASDKANDRRYLQCPAAVSVGLLKKFIRQKYGLSEDYRVDLLYNGDRDNNLENDLTLLDLAFMFKWNKAEPMCFHYRIFDKPVKATLVHPGWKRPAHSMMDEPPDDDGSSGQRDNSMKSSGTPSKLARISDGSSGNTGGSGSGGNSSSSQNSKKKCADSREEKAVDSGDVMEIDAEEGDEEEEEDEENEKPGKKSKKKKGRSRSRSGDVVVEKEVGKSGKRTLTLTLSKKYGIKQTRSCSKTSEGSSVVGSGIVEGVKITLPKSALQGKSSSSKKSPKKSVSSSGEEFSPSSSESSPCSSPTRVGGSSSSGSGSCGSKEGSVGSLKISIGKHKIVSSPTHHTHHHRHHKHKHHKHKKDKNKDRETRHSRRQSSVDAANKISNLAKNQVQQQQTAAQSGSSDKKSKIPTRGDNGPTATATKPDKSDGRLHKAATEAGQLTKTMNQLTVAGATAAAVNKSQIILSKPKTPIVTSTVVKDGLKNMVGTLKSGEIGTSARTSPVVLSNQSSIGPSQPGNQPSPASAGEKDTGSNGRTANANTVAGTVPESVQLQVPKSVTLIPVNPNAPMASHKLNRNIDKGRTGNSQTFTHPITNKSLHQITVTEVPPPDNKAGANPGNSNTGGSGATANAANTSNANTTSTLPHLDKALSSPSKQFNGPGSMEITKIYCDNPQTKPFDIGSKKLKERKCLDITISPSPMTVSGGLNKSGRKILEETLTYGSKVSNLNAPSQVKSRTNSLPTSNKVMNVSQIQQVPATLRTTSGSVKGESATKQRKSSLSIEPAKAGVTSYPEIQKPNVSRKGIGNLDSSIAIYEVNSMHRTPTPPKDKGIVVTPVGGAVAAKSAQQQQQQQQKSLGKRAFESVSAPGSQLKQTLQHGSGNKSQKSPGPERKREKLGGSGHHDSPLDLSGKSSRSPTDNRPTTPQHQQQQQAPLPSSLSRPKSTSPSERKSKGHASSASSASSSPSIPHNIQSSPGNNPTNAQSIHNIAQSLAHKHQQQSRDSRPQKSASPSSGPSNKSHVSAGHHLNIPNQNPLTHHSRSPPVIPIPAASPPGQFNPLRNLLTLSDAAMHMRSMQNSAMNHFAGYCANPSSAALAAAVAAGVFPPPGGAPGSALSPPLGPGMIPGLSPQSQFRHKASMPVHSAQMGKGSGLMSPGSVGVPGWPQALHMNMARGMVPSLSGPLVGPGQNPMASPPLNPLSNLYNSLAAASTAPSLMTPTSSNANQVAQRAPPQLRIPNPPPSERISSSSNTKNPNKSGNSSVSLNSHQQQQHHHKQQPQPPATALSKSASSSSTSSSASSNPSAAASHLLRSSALTSAAPLNTAASRSSKLNGMNSGSISSIANSLLEQRTASAAAANTNTFSAPSSLKPVTKSQSQSLKDAIPNSMKISNFLSSSPSPSKQGNDQATITSSSSSLAKMFSTLPPLMRPQSPPTTAIIPPSPSTADINVLALKSFVDSATNPLSVSAPPATPFTFTLTPPTATENVTTKSASLSPTKTSAFSPKAVTVSDSKKSTLLSPTLAGAAVSRDEKKEDFCLSNATETTHVMKSTISPPHRNPQAVNQAVRHIPNPSLLFNRSQQSSSLADRDGQAGSTKIARDISIRPKSPTVPIISSQQHKPSKETIIKPDTVSVEATKDDSVKTISQEHKEEGKEQKVEKRSQSPLAEQVKAPESKAVKDEVLGTEIKVIETPEEKLGSGENQSLETRVKIEQEASVPVEAVLKKPEVKEEIVVEKVTEKTVATVSTAEAEIPAVVKNKPPRIVFSAAEIFGARAPEPIKSKAEDQSIVVAVPEVEAVVIPAEVAEAVVKAPVDIASIVVMEEQKQVSVEAEAAVVEESGKATASAEEKVSESITAQLVQDVESISAIASISSPAEETESMDGTGGAVPEGEEEEKLLENVERIPEPMEIGLEESALDKIDAVPKENSLTIQEELEEEEELPDIDSEPEESPAKLAEQLTENLESVATELTQVTDIVGLEEEQTESSVQNSAPEYPEAEILEGNVLQLSGDASSEDAAVAEDGINFERVAAIQETDAATEEFPAEDVGEDSGESNGISERVLEIPEQNAEQEDHDELCMSGDGDSNGTVALSTASESVPAYDANENSDDLIIDPKAVEAELDAPSCTSASTSDENNSIELNSDNANPSPIVILNSSNDGDTARSCGSMEGKFEPTLSFSGLTRSIPEVRELQAVVAESEAPEEEHGQESFVDLGDSLSRDIDAVAGNDLPASPVQLSSDVIADEPMEIDEGLVEDSVSVSDIEEDKEEHNGSDSVQEVPAEVEAVVEEIAGTEDTEKIDITPAEEGTEEDGKVEKTPRVESTLDESQAAAGETTVEQENLDILLERSESAESLTLTETQNPEEMSDVPSQAEYDALTEEQLLEDQEEDDNVMDTDEAFETENKMETEDSGSSLIDLNAASGDLGLSNGSDDIVSILAHNDGIESENMSGVTDAVKETDSGTVSEPVTDSGALPETDAPGLGVAELEETVQEELESSNFKDVVMPNMDAMTTPPEELTQDSIAVSFGEDELISSEPAHPDNDNNSPPTMSSGVVEEEGNDNGIMMNHEDLSIPQFNPSSPTPPTSTSQPAQSPCLLPVVEASVEGAEKEAAVVAKAEEPANSFHGEKEITEGISTSAIPASNHVNETPLRPQPPSPPLQVKKMDNLEKVAAGFLATAATTINNNNNNNNNSFPGGSVVSCDIPIATATTTA